MGITSRIRDQLQGKKAAATFEWLGEEVNASVKQRRQVGRTFYRGFKLGKLTCYVGDTVLVRNADAFDPDCFDGCDIARVVQLYYTGDAFEPRRCEVRWYSRVTDINSNTFRTLPPGCPPIDKEREVVFEERNFVTDVDVESLFCLCTVEEVGPTTVPFTVLRKDNLKGPFFVCRFSFRSKKPQLQPLNLDGVDSIEKQETHDRQAARRSLVMTPNKSTGGKENAPKTPRSLLLKRLDSRNVSPEIAYQGESAKYELLRNVNSPARSSRTPTKPSTKSEAKTPKSAKKTGNRDVSPEIAYTGNSAKYELLRNVNSPARSSRTPTKSLVKSEVKTPKSGKKSGNRDVSPERTYKEPRYRVMTPSELDLPSHVKLKLRRLEDQSPETFGNVQLPTSLKRKATAEAEEFTTKKQRIALGDISQTQSPNRRRTVNVINYQKLNRGEVDKDGNATALAPKSKLVNKENRFSDFSSPTKRLATPTKVSAASPHKGVMSPSGKTNYESPFKSPVRNEKASSPSRSPLMSPKDRKENIKQIGKVRALKKDEITDLLGGSSDEDEDDQDEDDIEEPMDVEETEEKVEDKKSTRRVRKKSESLEVKSDPKSKVLNRHHYGLDIESDVELPFPFGTPDFKALKTPQKKVKVLPKSKSTAKKRFVCDDCGDKFSTRTELQDHEEDHDDFKPITKTPGRRKSSKSKKSENKTPRKTSRRSLATPGMPEREGPVAFPQTPLEKARAVLHVSAVPRELPCREEEYAEIYGFVEGKLQDGTGGCLYISGVPGTGKTATVREVVRLLKEMVSEGDLPSFEYQEINAMRLTEPHQLWVQVWKHLTGQKVTSAHAASLLEKRFSTPAPRREPTLLLVDELDMLWTRKQDVMYNLFDWPSRPGSKLIVVAIANTMDLPERVMINRVASRLGLTRMNFQPYNHEQLQTIVESRLMGIDAFDTNAVRLVARKTAAASGDARRALDICRRATEIAERKALTGGAPKSPTKSPRKSPMKRDKTKGGVQVELMDVDQAIKEMFSSPMIMAIRSCSVMEKFLLKGVISEFMRTGLEEAVLSRVIEQYGSISRIEGYQPVSISEIMLMLNRLAQQTLILTEHSRQDLAMRVRLNISMDDVTYALNQKAA